MKKILLSLILILLLPSVGHSANKWRDGSTTFFDGDTTEFNDVDTEADDHIIEPLDRFLINARQGMALIYDSASQITVSTGSIVCSNSGGTLNEIQRNTSNTTVTWSDIDTGAEASSTTYYVYANCDADATTMTFKISTSGTSPTGVTLYRKVGSFYNDSSSNIDQNKIYAEPYGAPFTDSSGIDLGRFLAIYDYGTSASSSTRRNPSTYFIAHGTTTDGTAVSNLPFTSSTSWALTCLMTSGVITQNVSITSKSASGFTCSDGLGNGNSIDWVGFGY